MNSPATIRETILVTGGSGFFGDILKRELLSRGFRVVSVDMHTEKFEHPLLMSAQGDIRDRKFMGRLFTEYQFAAVFHTAAILAHDAPDKELLWSTNVEGTRLLAEMAKAHAVRKIVFTSSNCLWGKDFGRPIREEDIPEPVEIYGRSKWEAEKILLGEPSLVSVIIRCPTIIDAGRLGLLSILFEFIDEGRTVWVVGGGANKYQFIYAKDLADACIRALGYPESTVFNIGSDNVKSFREVYEYVIAKVHSKSRVANFPKQIAIPLMKIAYAVGLSPLGPYQYKMIAENFSFDTAKIKKELHWAPTMTNEDMLYRAYEYYREHRQEIEKRSDAAAHKRAVSLGAIRVLKWLS